MIDPTPAFRLYARWRRAQLARQDAAAAQKAQLLKLIGRAAQTRFGRDHGFARLGSVADFQRAVPLRRYDQMWSDYWASAFPVLEDVSWPGRIPFFALSSGTTTGTSKYIPVTHTMNRANTRASLDILVHHLAHRRHSRAPGGLAFMLGSSTALTELAPGVHSGDLSGIALRHVPRWLQRFTFPPPHVAALKDWDAKLDAIAGLAPGSHIRVLGGTPSWLLMLFERQQQKTGTALSAAALYPELELLVHGGVDFAPYRARFEDFVQDRAELREVYPASEGFIALQDETPGAGLRLMLDNGLFFEFVPVDELGSETPTRHTVADAEPGTNYALALSSCSGCWAYVVGDTVRFVSRDPPRIRVTGRTSYFMSAFGEHLLGEEIEHAVAEAAQALAVAVTDYSMGALIPDQHGEMGGGHLFVVELATEISAQQRAVFAERLDGALCRQNDDYRHYRLEVRGIAAPKIMTVPHGTFAAWMKSRGKLGGQSKVPRVINDHRLFENLLRFSRAARAQ